MRRYDKWSVARQIYSDAYQAIRGRFGSTPKSQSELDGWVRLNLIDCRHWPDIERRAFKSFSDVRKNVF